MERIGHAQIQTTQMNLHTLPDADQQNLDALTRIWAGWHRTESRPVIPDAFLPPQSSSSSGSTLDALPTGPNRAGEATPKSSRGM